MSSCTLPFFESSTSMNMTPRAQTDSPTHQILLELQKLRVDKKYQVTLDFDKVVKKENGFPKMLVLSWIFWSPHFKIFCHQRPKVYPLPLLMKTLVWRFMLMSMLILMDVLIVKFQCFFTHH